MNRTRGQYTSFFSLSVTLTGILLLLTGLASSSCSQQGDQALYGKWKSIKREGLTKNGSPLDLGGGPKVIELRKDGTYLDGGRPGKFHLIDANHISLEVDGLVGTARFVLQSNRLDMWDPDGLLVEHYEKVP